MFQKLENQNISDLEQFSFLYFSQNNFDRILGYEL